MKNLFILVLFQLSINVTAQNQLQVNESKASHIICPEKVTYLQVGDHQKIIAEVVPEHNNIIRIKATGDFENESSLTFITKGKVYSLFVDYGDCHKISHTLEDFASIRTNNHNGLIPEYLMRETCHQILVSRNIKTGNSRSKKDGIVIRLYNVYIKHGMLFFELEFTNRTAMDYNISNIYWWIDDKKELKATNVQEYQLNHEFRYYGFQNIPAKTSLREVFVLPKLNIPDKRILRFEILEKALGNTGRKLSLEISNRNITNAIEL